MFELFFSQFCKSDLSRYEYLEVFQTVPWTSKKTRLDFMWTAKAETRVRIYVRLQNHFWTATWEKSNFDMCAQWKTQINLRIRAVWSDSSQSTWRGFESLASKMRPGIQISLLVLGFNDTSALWVILCRLPEKGRKEIEEIVEEMKEREREKRGNERKWRNRRNYNIPTPTLTCCKDSSPYQTVSKYQLDAPVTKATGHFCLTKLRLDLDQATRMRRLIWIFAGHTCLKVRFLTLPLSFKQTFLIFFLLPHENISCGIH